MSAVAAQRAEAIAGAPAADARPDRLHFLDGLRGLAAVFVVFSHGGERMSPAVDGFSSHVLQLGQFGVSLFFLISGFVIPMTLERRRLVGFWVSRVFRLYPLYLLVLAVAFVLHLAGLWYVLPDFGPRYWLTNATMLQQGLGVPHVVVTFWTLYFEMVFYLAMSVLFVLRLHRFPVTLLLVSLTVVNAHSVWHFDLPFQLDDSGPVLSFMFLGTVFYRLYTGQLKTWVAVAAGAVFVASMIHVAAAEAAYSRATLGDVNLHGTNLFWPMVTAWTLALLGFAGAYRLRRATWPRLLVWLGAISYSIYLWHLLVMDVGRRDGETSHVYVNPTVTYVGYFAVTIGISWLSYRLLERPAIHIGHRLARSLARRGNQEPAPDADAPATLKRAPS